MGAEVTTNALRPARGPTRARALATAVVLAVTTTVASAPAWAEPLPVRTTGVGQRDGKLKVSVGLSDLFGSEERKRLTSGFASRILIRVQLRRADRSAPVVVLTQRSEIVYDLWDETFRIRVVQGTGPETVTETRDPNRAVWIATALLHFPLVDLPRLDPGTRYFLVVRGDLNPISPETVAEVRRWLRPAGGAQHQPGTSDVDGFFGSFVTLFANPRIEHSDRDVRFVSQVFNVSP